MTSRAGEGTRSLKTLIMLVGVGVLTLSLPSGTFASTHHHHHHDTGSDQDSSSRRQARLHRLAVKEKAAWRRHLRKVQHMSPEERLVLKHHEHRARLRAELAEEEAVDEQRLDHPSRHRHHHASDDDTADATPRHHHRRHADDSADTDTPRPRHRHASEDEADATTTRRHKHAVAEERSAHERRLAEHNSRLARKLAVRRARLAEVEAKHRALTARLLAEHNARLAKIQAAHERRIAARAQRAAEAALKHDARAAKQLTAKAQRAAKGSNYVAEHGDDSGGRAISFWQTVADNVPVKVITVDLNDKNVKVSAVMSRDGNGTSEPFKQMIQRANPNVAVTGTFFSVDNLKPVGDIVIDGSLIHFGGMGTALCVTPNNHAEMVTCQWGRHHDWSHYDFVCACGPRLLSDNKIVLDPRAERFKDRHMLAPNSRIAVGITPGNKLVFAMTRAPIYLGRLAKVMKSLGCADAMNLDAGTSTGFYYNGSILARPGRKLTNMIVVYGHKEQYERELFQLCPRTYRKMPANTMTQASTAKPSRIASLDGPKSK